MSVFEQTVEALKILKENAERYKKEKYALEASIIEEGRKMWIEFLPELVWDVEYFDGPLMHLELKGGKKFEEFMGIMKKLRNIFKSTKLDVRLDQYEFELYYDGYNCRILDVYVMDERGEKFTHVARAEELLYIFGKYLILNWDSVRDKFKELINGAEAAIRKLEDRVLYLENLEACLLEAKEIRKNEDRRS